MRLFDRLAASLGLKGAGPEGYSRFIDWQGNFEIVYPKSWRYDKDIAVVDGKYTICFLSPDGLCQFTVSVDALLKKGFRFAGYAKCELESPTSGIYTKMKGSVFKSMPAYRREYRYSSGSRRFFGGGVMFFTGEMVFSISWSAPENQKERLTGMFEHMLKALEVKKSDSIGNAEWGERP